MEGAVLLDEDAGVDGGDAVGGEGLRESTGGKGVGGGVAVGGHEDASTIKDQVVGVGGGQRAVEVVV